MTRDEIIRLAEEHAICTSADSAEFVHDGLMAFVAKVSARAAASEREACAKACDEMGEHWAAFKDTALLNGDTALSNAASGEPRAAGFLAATIRARGVKWTTAITAPTTLKATQSKTAITAMTGQPGLTRWLMCRTD